MALAHHTLIAWQRADDLFIHVALRLGYIPEAVANDLETAVKPTRR